MKGTIKQLDKLSTFVLQLLKTARVFGPSIIMWNLVWFDKWKTVQYDHEQKLQLIQVLKSEEHTLLDKWW